MTTIHPAFKEDNVAVITGAASGIGLAAARKFAGFGICHAGGSGVGVLFDSHAAELPQEVFRDHEKIRHAV